MKSIWKYGMEIIFFFLLVAVFGCSKKDNANPKLTNSTISAKWVVDGVSEFVSFEFSEDGFYIVTMAGSGEEIWSGTYTINNDGTITLSDFGVLKMGDINDGKISFSVTVAGSNGGPIEVSGTKTSEYSKTDRTKMFCRKWYYAEGNATVYFSPASTYFIEYLEYGLNSGLATWQWQDADEKYICYSWQGAPTCDGTNDVKIVELTNQKLVLLEDGDTLVLVPYSSINGGKLNYGNNTKSRKIRKGIFSK